MTIAAGSRLGPYEILAPLGAGGMGEVYKARDTRLGRTVAIKVLPQHMSASPEVRQRFEREAKMISQLSHPHICALYDVGREGETEYLVMEYLEGETLAHKLAFRGLPLDQSLRCAVEIADALDRAHRQGVVHRDLKPSNIMLTKAGVKLLDFGLAKTFERPLDAARREQAAAGRHPMAESDMTAIPTVVGPPTLTQEGTILGTFQYMAPEQLQGQEADARTDIFALGAILYEMATGRKAFPGTSQASLIGAILHTEPAPISSIQPMSPPALDRLVKKCLAKDPEDRWQSARDVGSLLGWVAERAGEARALRPTRRGRERLSWIVTGLATMAMILILLTSRIRGPVSPQKVSFSVYPPAKTALASFDVQHQVTISPDGLRLAFVAESGGSPLIWLRPLDASKAEPLSGTHDAKDLFWSPDSRFLAFFADGKLKKIPVTGGPAQSLCDLNGSWIHGTWNERGTILVGLAEAAPGQEGLYRVSSEGGQPTRLSPVPESRLVFGGHPAFLPDGQQFLFLATDPQGQRSLYASSLDSKTVRRLSAVASRVESVRSGHLIFVREGALVAQPFDASALRFSGEPIPIAENVGFFAATGSADFSVSSNGVLAYRSVAGNNRLVLLDRQGRELGSFGGVGSYDHPRLSHDGRRLAIDRTDTGTGMADLWVYDVRSLLGTRVTSSPEHEFEPVWSPDGSQIVFAAGGAVAPNLRRLTLGGETEALVPFTGLVQSPSDWSTDGRLVAYSVRDPVTGWDIWTLPIETRKPMPAVQTPFNEHSACFSPNGRLIAFTSDQSGQEDVYIQPTAGRAERVRVSIAGGAGPRWRRDGRELFYLSPDKRLISVSVSGGEHPQFGTPTTLFKNDTFVWPEGTGGSYDVSPDGQTFVVNTVAPDAPVEPIQVVLNWPTGLKSSR